MHESFAGIAKSAASESLGVVEQPAEMRAQLGEDALSSRPDGAHSDAPSSRNRGVVGVGHDEQDANES